LYLALSDFLKLIIKLFSFLAKSLADFVFKTGFFSSRTFTSENASTPGQTVPGGSLSGL
jgi:hypothetical protein